MGKSNIEMPDLPEAWKDKVGGISDNKSGAWPDFLLPDGQKLGDVIQQHRDDLRSTVEQLQDDPQSLEGGLGYPSPS